MARLGKLPVQIPQGTTVSVEGETVTVKGPKGTLTRVLPKRIVVKVEGQEAFVEKSGDSNLVNALHGTFRAHLMNMVKGVTEGWRKQLEISGPGYRAEARGRDLVITAGFSHPVIISAPEGITFSVEKATINVDGFDKDLVGQIAANIRSVRKPNPYSGSGIKYATEVVRRKAGKQAGAKSE